MRPEGRCFQRLSLDGTFVNPSWLPEKRFAAIILFMGCVKGRIRRVVVALLIVFSNFVVLATAAPSPPAEEVEGLVASGKYDLALEALDALLGSATSKALGAEERVQLEKLRARCLFELGDYPSCEERIRALLAGPAGPGTSDHVECLNHLAQALTFQDLHDDALKAVEEAVRLQDAPALRRLAITVLLRAGRSDEILPHAESLLATDANNSFAHFVRGIALSGKGRLGEALRELSWGLKTPGAQRDAHFELALVRGKLNEPERALEHLLEIVVEDPYDDEACYQAALQLGRIRTPASREAAAHIRRYFMTFKKAQGESAREYPFQAVGRAALAALMRAARWRRLCVYDRTISEIRRAQAVARDNPEPFFYAADFWASVGLPAEAESALCRLETRPAGASEDISQRVQKLRAALAAGMNTLEAQADTPLEAARLEVAKSSWQHARAPLEALLAAAVAAGKMPVADRTARLLLARDPQSIRALAFFAQRTAVPSLLVPRLHYLTRLVRLLPDDERYRGRLLRARQEFLGKGSILERSQ